MGWAGHVTVMGWAGVAIFRPLAGLSWHGPHIGWAGVAMGWSEYGMDWTGHLSEMGSAMLAMGHPWS
jgi:hypothetical protein